MLKVSYPAAFALDSYVCYMPIINTFSYTYIYRDRTWNILLTVALKNIL